MNPPDPSRPDVPALPKSPAKKREDRRAEALKANLMRRKAQARARSSEGPAEGQAAQEQQQP